MFTGKSVLVDSSGFVEPNHPNIGFPRYSPDDSRLVFQRRVAGVGTVRQVPLDEYQVEPAGPSGALLTEALLPNWVTISTRPTAVEEASGSVPEALSLDSNYPNPFNPETTIAFSLPVAGEIELAVYDVRGAQVAILASGFKAAGEYAVRWSGRNAAGRAVASGVYFYRLKMGGGTNGTLTGKMILVR